MKGRDSYGVWAQYVCTAILIKWIANKDLLYSTGISAQCYVTVCIGGEFGGEWLYVYVWLSPSVFH